MKQTREISPKILESDTLTSWKNAVHSSYFRDLQAKEAAIGTKAASG